MIHIPYVVIVNLSVLLKTSLLQLNYSGSNTDGSFITSVWNSFLSPLEKKSHSCSFGIIKGDSLINYENSILYGIIRIASMRPILIRPRNIPSC